MRVCRRRILPLIMYPSTTRKSVHILKPFKNALSTCGYNILSDRTFPVKHNVAKIDKTIYAL